MKDAPIPKLPVWRTVGLAYRSLLDHPGAAIRCSWAWLLLMPPVVFAVSWLMWLVTSRIDAKAAAAGEGSPDLSTAEQLIQFLATWPGLLIELPALCSMAVAWHRLLLRSEIPALALRHDRPVLAYLGVSTLIAALGQVGTAGFYVGGIAMGLTSFIVTIVLGLFLIARASVYLPAVALADSHVTFRQVWLRTRGNTWRLAMGTLVAWLPILPATIIVLWPFDDTKDQLVNSLVSVGVFWGTALTTFIAVAFLSYAYRHFFFEPPRTAHHGT